ncbi:MAG: DUF3465 domain-containing protein [Motiliproteus sp.]|nr:DUF3465 domain-containing protein [Motiliproteus sp.]MCW9052103.1 DUF3465 domain-containing protein [Motiliproteus sp.]
MIKKTVMAILLIAGGMAANQFWPLLEPIVSSKPSDTDRLLQVAFDTRQSDLQVGGSGSVYKILSDDLKGSRHQRFILKLASGQTLLVAHNIDLAKRIDNLKEGDQVEFYGEYEWTKKGGVIHWTHRDPRGRHAHGWLKHQGRTYH